MNIFEQEIQKNKLKINPKLTEKIKQSIPVIDIQSLTDTPFPSEKCIREIEKACIETGFFMIKNHAISKETRYYLQQAARNFFSRTDTFKKQYKIGKNGNHSGYVPFTEKGLYKDETAQRSYEAFDLSQDLPVNDPDHLTGNIFYGPNQWPEVNHFKKAVNQYYLQVQSLSHLLVKAFEKILAMPEGYILDKMNKPTSQLRLIHYVENKQTLDALNNDMGAHTDYELFTILYSTEEGLQTQNTCGEWVNVPVVDDTLIINIGDMLEVWSNGKFKSNLHRVNCNGKERYSFPFFASLNYNAKVSPWLTSSTGQSDNYYQSVTAGEHLLTQVSQDFSYLRQQISSKSNPFLGTVSFEENPYEKTVALKSGGQ